MLPCPKCHSADQVRCEPSVGGYAYVVSCLSCFDAEYVGDPPRAVMLSPIAHGPTPMFAIAEWDEMAEMGA